MSSNNGNGGVILCPKCRMTLHKRSFMESLDKIVLCCPECGKVWVVPWPLGALEPLHKFEVKDRQTIDRALDGMRI